MAKKSLGQHWLNDPKSLQLIVDSGEVGEQDVVVEIGPGHGALTRLLAGRAGKVIAIETDHQLVEILRREFPKSLYNDRVEIVHRDIMKFDLSTLPVGYKVVANIPYYLTSNLLRNLLEATNPPVLMSLLVQKEVANRICAKPGRMSVLALSVQYYAEPKITGTVAADKFEPVPEVDSAVLQIRRRASPAFRASKQKLFRLVKAGFGERRKQLKNSLAGSLRQGDEQIADLLGKARIKQSARAQELSLDDWQKLYQTFNQAGIL